MAKKKSKKPKKVSKKPKSGKYNVKWLKGNLSWIIGAFGMFFFLMTIILWTKEPSSPATTIPTTTIQRFMDNDLFFGWNYRDDYYAHNFICKTCCCDQSRKDFIYVSNGYVEFDLQAKPEQTNILTISVGNLNENCRENDVYVNGFYAGNLNKEANWTMKTEFRFNITPKSDQVHIKIEHVGKVEKCWWGNDLTRARIDVI